jgi:hypothetical protein
MSVTTKTIINGDHDTPHARDDEDRIGRLLDLAERNHRLLVALARDNGLDADGRPVDEPEFAAMKGAE